MGAPSHRQRQRLRTRQSISKIPPVKTKDSNYGLANGVSGEPNPPDRTRAGVRVQNPTKRCLRSVNGEDAFTLDPAIDIAGAQPKEFFPWHFNLGRQRVRDGKPERTAYSPTSQDDFRVPEKFAKLWGN